jgi:hypothetical protein
MAKAPEVLLPACCTPHKCLCRAADNKLLRASWLPNVVSWSSPKLVNVMLFLTLQESASTNGFTACSQQSACSFVSQGTVAWPGCGVPANEEERLAATLQLQLIGKEPNAGLQRYVELVAAVLKVMHW